MGGQVGAPIQPGYPQQGVYPQQGGFGQPGQNPAVNAIMQQLTQPRPGGLAGVTGGMAGTGQATGGGIAGVGTTVVAEGIKIYNDRTKYNEWEFIYDPKKEKRPVASPAALLPGGQLPGGQLPGSATDGGKGSSGFGGQSGMGGQPYPQQPQMVPYPGQGTQQQPVGRGR
jgi:hypothetical protein